MGKRMELMGFSFGPKQAHISRKNEEEDRPKHRKTHKDIQVGIDTGKWVVW